MIVNSNGEASREALSYEREDFWATTSNKQLNFLQHVKTLLEINGRCAIVAPDNVSVWGYSFPIAGTIGLVDTPKFMAAHQPVEYGMANLLMTFIIVPLDSEPAQFYIEEWPGQTGVTEPRYIDGTWEDLSVHVLIDMVPSPDDDDEPCFTMNPAALPIASATWGGVKALYR